MEKPEKNKNEAPKKKPKPELAAALRANLKRRKAASPSKKGDAS